MKITKLAPFTLAALVPAVAVIMALSPAAADPNVETQLPAGGVLSIERDASDLWTVTTTGPASEIKVMSASPQIIVCGTNHADPCSTVETFTLPAECVYIQLDGIPGENSTDPYVCRPHETEPPTSTPTSTPPTHSDSPSPTPTDSPTPVPTYTPPVLNCQPPYVPGWLDEHGNPTSCINDGPMPPSTGTPKPSTPATPPQTSSPTEPPSSSTAATPPPSKANQTPPSSSSSTPTGSSSGARSASSAASPATLAATGVDSGVTALVGLAAGTGVGLVLGGFLLAHLTRPARRK